MADRPANNPPQKEGVEPDAVSLAGADLDETDVRAVTEVLRSGRLALGPCAVRFEEALAELVGVDHAVAVSSGTAGLHLIVRALGLRAGDEVLLPSFTFVACANVLLAEGLRPVFVDIEPDTLNIDPDDAARRVGPRTRALMAVDVFGHPADWDRLETLARQHELLLIDDCCEALGARYKDRAVGSFGNAGAFAFYPNKQITTGEGGMIVTRDGQLAAAARRMRNHGRDRTSAWLEHDELGFNYRMDEMSAALGCSQLARIDELLARRRRVAAEYSRRLADLPELSLPVERPEVRHGRFVYVVRLAPHLDRRVFMESLATRGIPSRAYFPPLHRLPHVLEALEGAPEPLPRTEAAAATTVALPFHGRLEDAELDRVAEACRHACVAAVSTA